MRQRHQGTKKQQQLDDEFWMPCMRLLIIMFCGLSWSNVDIRENECSSNGDKLFVARWRGLHICFPSQSYIRNAYVLCLRTCLISITFQCTINFLMGWLLCLNRWPICDSWIERWRNNDWNTSRLLKNLFQSILCVWMFNFIDMRASRITFFVFLHNFHADFVS